MFTLGIRELAERAKKEGAYDLAQGVVQTSPPPAVLLDALRQLPLEEYSNYNNKRGVMEFRTAAQTYLAERGWQVPVDQIITTAGVVGAITAALLTKCRPGDKVLMPEPFFIGDKLLLEALGFNIEYFPVPLDQEPDWAAIMAKMSEVQAVIITSPANPTGQCLPAEQRKALCEAATKNKCLLILDEVYREFVWSETVRSDAHYQDLDLTYAVVARSFSKTFAIPGWRIGFAITAPENIELMATRHDALYLGSSTLGQYALANALTNHKPELDQYVDQLREQCQANLKLLSAAFTAYGMEPLPVPASYFLIIKHNRASDLAAMEELIAKKVVVTPVNILTSTPDHDTGYIRIHFAVSPQTAEAVARILQA